MPTKITLIIDNPSDLDAFEADGAAARRARRAAAQVRRLESAKVWPKEDGTRRRPTARSTSTSTPTTTPPRPSPAPRPVRSSALLGATVATFTGLFSDIESA